MFQRIVIAAMIVGSAGVCAKCGDDAFVPFVIPQEISEGSLIALPAGEAIRTDSQRVLIRDGHFYKGDKRFRVWGVNFCFGANFPTHADAEKIAARLAAFGVNAVRFHHMDTQQYPNGIWDAADPMKLSAEALDRLDYFLDQLAKRGIVANINLHVSRSDVKYLKLPAAPRDADKIVDVFTPPLVDSQKRYASDLLGHVNKYRSVRYADDPAVAFVEINNENSLFMWGAEQTLPDLPDYYAKLLRQAFSVWLKARYGTTDKLATAWGVKAEPLGDDMLAGAPLGKWLLNKNVACQAKLVPQADGAVRVDITKADSTDWHIQLIHGGLKLVDGQYYTLTFRARADKPRSLSLNVGQSHQPWGMLGLSRDVKLTQEWQAFRLGFFASAADDNARVNFQPGGSTIAVELAEVELRPGGSAGLDKADTGTARQCLHASEVPFRLGMPCGHTPAVQPGRDERGHRFTPRRQRTSDVPA